MITSDMLDRKVGLTAAAIMCFSIFHITNAQTARMYPLFTFSTILSTFFYRLQFYEDNYLRNIGGYAFFSAIMLSTHLYSAFVFISKMIAVIMSVKIYPPSQSIRDHVIGGFTGSVFLSLPSGFIMIQTI